LNQETSRLFHRIIPTTLDIILPIVGLVRQIYAQALVDGKGDQDFSAVAATAEKLSGVKFKK